MTKYEEDKQRIMNLLKRKDMTNSELRNLLHKNGQALRSVLNKMCREKVLVKKRDLNMKNYAWIYLYSIKDVNQK